MRINKTKACVAHIWTLRRYWPVGSVSHQPGPWRLIIIPLTSSMRNEVADRNPRE